MRDAVNDPPGQRDGAPPLVLIPGLGSDARLYAPQRAVFGRRLIVTPWPDPRPGDMLDDYAGRIAAWVREHVGDDQPLDFGGTSFGGMLAAHAARRLRLRRLLLIASNPTPHAVAPALRLAGGLGPALATALGAAAQALGVELLARWEGLSPGHRRLLREMLRGLPREMIRAHVRMIMRRGGSRPTTGGVSVEHIHGARDPVMPLRRLDAPPDVVLADGRHLLTLTHPEQVNAFLAARTADAAPGTVQPALRR